MSSIIGNNDTNKQWAVIRVVLYRKKNGKICEVQDFKSNTGKTFNKRSHRFYVHFMPVDSEKLRSKVFRINTQRSVNVYW